MSRLGALAQTAFAVSLALVLAACENEGPAERAGEEIDNAAEQAGEAIARKTDN